MKIRDLYTIGLVFVIAGILLSVGAKILTTVSTAEYLSKVATQLDESTNFAANNTPYLFGKTPVTTVIAMYNDSAHTCTYDPSLYDFNETHIWIYVNGTGVCPNMTTGVHYYDYKYKYSPESYYVLENATSGVREVTTWLPTIGLIVAAAIIIGVLFRSFFAR